MKIERFDVIKHEKMMDVAFEVEYTFDDGLGVHVTGYWVNQGFEKSWYLPYYDKKRRRQTDHPYGVNTQSFKIPREKLGEWMKVSPPMPSLLQDPSVCYRTANWVKIDAA